jgi:hypothetical protein
VQLRDARLERAAFDADVELPHLQVEQLLVRELREPLGTGERMLHGSRIVRGRVAGDRFVWHSNQLPPACPAGCAADSRVPGSARTARAPIAASVISTAKPA